MNFGFNKLWPFPSSFSSLLSVNMKQYFSAVPSCSVDYLNNSVVIRYALLLFCSILLCFV